MHSNYLAKIEYEKIRTVNLLINSSDQDCLVHRGGSGSGSGKRISVNWPKSTRLLGWFSFLQTEPIFFESLPRASSAQNNGVFFFFVISDPGVRDTVGREVQTLQSGRHRRQRGRRVQAPSHRSRRQHAQPHLICKKPLPFVLPRNIYSRAGLAHKIDVNCGRMSTMLHKDCPFCNLSEGLLSEGFWETDVHIVLSKAPVRLQLVQASWYFHFKVIHHGEI